MPEPNPELAAKYEILRDAAATGRDLQYSTRTSNNWHDVSFNDLGDIPQYNWRIKPNPPKPQIIVSVDGVLGRGASLSHDSLPSKVLTMFHDARFINPANTYTGQRATLTLTIYPEGRKMPDTVTVPRSVVEEIVRWWKHDTVRGTHGPAAEAIGTLIEAVKGGA